ncbi:hypothetical protein DPMN_166322 [Dreissena polymorpha]|uniref:Uncharacterized protein n=1 Tax=Dreissena polymorpha TaxID=45954 RepID=A0A9D4EYS0_DREPO|nr:hypothetical protein DPMN_166322 [Dreissena polymorpha]
MKVVYSTNQCRCLLLLEFGPLPTPPLSCCLTSALLVHHSCVSYQDEYSSSRRFAASIFPVSIEVDREHL